MGLLFCGKPLDWEQTKKHVDYIKILGVEQFINIWNREKGREDEEILWGDELEYMIISFDHLEKNAKLALRQAEILETFVGMNIKNLRSFERDHGASFHAEFGAYMVESTPASPYSASLADLLSVEGNMRHRRKLLHSIMKHDEIPMTLTAFPRLGVPGQFTEPYGDPVNATSCHSLFSPEEALGPHARFPMCTANINKRRGSKISSNVPVFIDLRTIRPFIDPTIPWHRSIYPDDCEARNGAALIDHIYMDSTQFGMGCCCLQVTLQANNVHEARRLYDALIPLTPVLMAMTAASPVWRGWLADVDCRWSAVAACLDDRTEEERGLKPLKDSKYQIPKSRYDSVDSYLSMDPMNRPEYNDLPMPYDDGIYKHLRNNDVDELLSKHIAHLFIRDPIIIFSESLEETDPTKTIHFENIQTSNWQSMRFKPPPLDSPIGWRVEIRTMEVQITDFENAAFAIFVVLLSRAILQFDLNFYIPMSKVDENMKRAQQCDAARSSRLYFRKEVGNPSPPPSDVSSSGSSTPVDSSSRDSFLPLSFSSVERIPNINPIDDEYEEMTVNEIFNGKPDHFPGLLALVDNYLESLNDSRQTKREVNKYLDFIRRRANGTIQTDAAWIRDFIRSHPTYRFDSAVSQEINYDLIVALDKIERGIRPWVFT